MAGSFKNLRSTSRSHVFQQVLRENQGLARRATRDRDPMALQAGRAAQKGVSSVIMLDAVLRGYDAGRFFIDPIPPFAAPEVNDVVPPSGPATGGTLVRVKGTGLRVTSLVRVSYSIVPTDLEVGHTDVDFTVVSDEELTIVMPPGIENFGVYIHVRTPGGWARGAFNYIPVVVGGPYLLTSAGQRLVTSDGNGIVWW